MKILNTDPLGLPCLVKAEVEGHAKADRISVNRFGATAGAEKPAALDTACFFAERRARADMAAFDRLMQRMGGEPLQPDDTIR